MAIPYSETGPSVRETPTWVEYWSHHHLVVHTLRRLRSRRTLCGNRVAEMLPARSLDLARAVGDGKTILATCYECEVASA